MAINKGVPQGTSMAPLLFNVYVSDILTEFHDNNIIIKSFADDFIVYTIFDDLIAIIAFALYRDLFALYNLVIGVLILV